MHILFYKIRLDIAYILEKKAFIVPSENKKKGKKKEKRNGHPVGNLRQDNYEI